MMLRRRGRRWWRWALPRGRSTSLPWRGLGEVNEVPVIHGELIVREKQWYEVGVVDDELRTTINRRQKARVSMFDLARRDAHYNWNTATAR
jgi:hypothetical protein